MAGHRETGEYHVVPMGMVAGHNIFCDMDGGGWIVISNRVCLSIRPGCLLLK